MKFRLTMAAQFRVGSRSPIRSSISTCPDLRGKRVLDVGPASGYFSFLFEQMGANVTALEIVDPAQFDKYGENPLTTARYGRDPYNTSVFLRLRDVLASQVTYRRGSVYDIGREVCFEEKFDLVFMGSLLCHIRDPIGALQHAASVCHGSGHCYYDSLGGSVERAANAHATTARGKHRLVGSE
ncbi:MAG: methyltransferase domain-containing protein [Rhodospirillales bacterium]